MSSSLASSKLVVESEFFKVWKNCSTDLVYDQSISCLCTILEIQLPKLDSSRHCNAHTHTLHFMHYILPRKLIAQAWCHYSMYQNMEDRKEGGKRKWPIKEGLSRFSLTSFLLQQADMTLNRALSKWFHWTLHMFIFLSLFGILHFVSMDGNNRRLMSSECTWTNPLSIRCAHMCVLSSNIQSWAD